MIKQMNIRQLLSKIVVTFVVSYVIIIWPRNLEKNQSSQATTMMDKQRGEIGEWGNLHCCLGDISQAWEVQQAKGFIEENISNFSSWILADLLPAKRLFTVRYLGGNHADTMS